MTDKSKREQNGPADAVGREEPEFSSGFAARRQVLKIGFGAMCCAGGAQVVWPLFRYMTAAEGGEADPVPVAKDKLPAGTMVKVLWGRTPCIIVNESGSVYVLSRVCTHLGCLVDWNEAKQRFICPCHEGYFDKAGKAISGPPPRGLDRVPFKTTETAYIIGLEPDEGPEGEGT